jgi:hypothetical protein
VAVLGAAGATNKNEAAAELKVTAVLAGLAAVFLGGDGQRFVLLERSVSSLPHTHSPFSYRQD